jgi:glycosyltransferase involved in cell wall biosynthesis
MDFSPAYPPSRALEGVRVSVIIPALNEEKVIGQCLDSLARLDFPRGSFEVILVDNGSTDRTVEIARSFSSILNLTVLQKWAAHVSALRNLGASQARGGHLAFLDSDCIVPPTWMSQAIALLNQKGIGVIGAHFRVPDESRWVARAWYGDLSNEKQGDLVWVPGCNTWVTRPTFKSVGGFDESLETNEDCEFCDRVRAAGLRVVGDSALAVVHLGTPQTLSDFYRKIRWHSTDGLRVFVRDLPRMTNARPLLFGLYTLVCLGGTGVGAAIAVWQNRFGVLAAFLGALLLPSFLLSLRLVFQRKKWSHLFPLTLMHLVYGLARGQSLLEFRNWVDSRNRLRNAVPGPGRAGG